MLADSSARVERIQESYEALQDAKRGFANDFRQLLKTYMDMMENMEIVSAKEIEASLRERLDTESIAVAREAASYEAPVYDDVGQQPTVVPEEPAADDDAATQSIEPVETAGEAPQSEPLAEEPQVEEPQVEEPEAEPQAATDEPPTLSHEPEAQPSAEEEPSPPQESAAGEEPAAADEVEREEPSLAEERSSESFFDREESGPSSSGEGQRDSRIFRASRFLRRRE
jgi:cell division initiation protein